MEPTNQPSEIELGVEDPTSAAAVWCIQSYFAELDRRFDAGFDPAQSISADAAELVEPAGLLLVAWRHGEPVGCGALKFHGEEPAEIKRMWVSPAARGSGSDAAALRAGATGRSARSQHRSARDQRHPGRSNRAVPLRRVPEVEPFNDEPYAHHWFEKHLAI